MSSSAEWATWLIQAYAIQQQQQQRDEVRITRKDRVTSMTSWYEKHFQTCHKTVPYKTVDI